MVGIEAPDHPIGLGRSGPGQAVFDTQRQAQPVELMITAGLASRLANRRSVNSLPLSVSSLLILIGHRHKLSMISTVTSQGKTRWMIVEEAFSSDKLIGFLAALVKDADKKIFLVLDNLRVHHSRPVKAWLAERKEQIEVFCLPSYSPEPNPDERLNADLKQALGSRVQMRTKDRLKEATRAHMDMLNQQPQRVRSYFDDPRVKYAA